ncbi:hypothetical protein HHK36_016138 [Tetracentron sinense]|uniref:Ubiquitin-like domain-containing protein n=1 Tax=Tetracentron sinense TaxID=13715 RepID=A0A835DB80_TETSI|nr:hypothetical protein HHK36_016138 [Tetracentron sinense]
MEGDGGPYSDLSTPTMNVHVKFSGRSIPISLSPDSTVGDLKSLLQPLTNVLPRGQKLIFKGKVLVDATSLKSSEVTNGSKLMLMASQGLHQGDGPITKEASKPVNFRKIHDKIKEAPPVDKSRSERWKLTGIIALSESHLKVIPDEVWACGPSVRVLDIKNNYLREVPAKIGSLSSMQKLFLSANDILDDCISWEGVTSLKSLTVLSVSQNHLTTLPSALGTLTSLRELHVSYNKLTCLPVEIQLLTQLQVLKASNNRISSVPSSIGNCISLIEVDLSSNLLVELPHTFGNLQYLKKKFLHWIKRKASSYTGMGLAMVQTLHLDNNGLKSLPSTLFKMCSQLSTLDLHGTEITMDLLRQFEGWNDFDERRRLKHQKQLDFRVGSSAKFDEGADKN